LCAPFYREPRCHPLKSGPNFRENLSVLKNVPWSEEDGTGSMSLPYPLPQENAPS
jgi:hypothetical protein